jgi:hypothetical protein
VVTTVEEPDPWERVPGERAVSYAAFRAFRDLGPTRRLDRVLPFTEASYDTVRHWSSRWAWWRRAEAWDSEQYREEDRERLEAIRVMHQNHQRAGRAAMRKGLEALQELPASHVPAGAAARLLELGARLERQTLIHSVEELQGVEEEDAARDDPWQRIADELIGSVDGDERPSP